MITCVFDRATGVFLSGVRWGDLPHDEATQVKILLPDFPEAKTERWDGGTGVRPATPQELTAAETQSPRAKLLAEIDRAATLADLRDIIKKLI